MAVYMCRGYWNEVMRTADSSLAVASGKVRLALTISQLRGVEGYVQSNSRQGELLKNKPRVITKM